MVIEHRAKRWPRLVLISADELPCYLLTAIEVGTKLPLEFICRVHYVVRTNRALWCASMKNESLCMC
jgi:hypothetical protein